MSTAAQEYKARKLKEKRKAGTLKESTKAFNRCSQCGRTRGYIRQFGMCRICVREKANEGVLPGVTKSSW
ncbi:type Z 30S ribosomal protein S14 [Candidatus Dojkabacteria bacterium]|nr:type Z 30S ribosomal protein S14 [Candidatus Dojkabacteria bacterium]